MGLGTAREGGSEAQCLGGSLGGCAAQDPRQVLDGGTAVIRRRVDDALGEGQEPDGQAGGDDGDQEQFG